MYLYKKTIQPKNRAGKITALLCLLCGGATFVLANRFFPYPAVAQSIGVILICGSVYIATAYLLREYTFSVTQSKNFSDEDSSFSEKFDFIIFERKNMKRYTYNTEFAASRMIEVQASLDDENFSILVSYDEELLRVLQGFFQEDG